MGAIAFLFLVSFVAGAMLDTPAAGAAANDAAANVAAADATDPVPARLVNHAAQDCGAQVTEASPKTKNKQAILQSDRDAYLLSPCSSTMSVGVELCQEILITQVQLANHELFSSMVHQVNLYIQGRRPGIDWMFLDTIFANDTRVLQSFFIKDPIQFTKYLKLEVVSHHGNEFYCPLTILRVFGITMLEDFRSDKDSLLAPPALAEPLASEPALTADNHAAGAPQHESPGFAMWWRLVTKALDAGRQLLGLEPVAAGLPLNVAPEETLFAPSITDSDVATPQNPEKLPTDLPPVDINDKIASPAGVLESPIASGAAQDLTGQLNESTAANAVLDANNTAPDSAANTLVPAAPPLEPPITASPVVEDATVPDPDLKKVVDDSAAASLDVPSTLEPNLTTETLPVPQRPDGPTDIAASAFPAAASLLLMMSPVLSAMESIRGPLFSSVDEEHVTLASAQPPESPSAPPALTTTTTITTTTPPPPPTQIVVPDVTAETDSAASVPLNTTTNADLAAPSNASANLTHASGNVTVDAVPAVEAAETPDTGRAAAITNAGSAVGSAPGGATGSSSSGGEKGSVFKALSSNILDLKSNLSTAWTALHGLGMHVDTMNASLIPRLEQHECDLERLQEHVRANTRWLEQLDRGHAAVMSDMLKLLQHVAHDAAALRELVGDPYVRAVGGSDVALWRARGEGLVLAMVLMLMSSLVYQCLLGCARRRPVRSPPPSPETPLRTSDSLNSSSRTNTPGEPWGDPGIQPEAASVRRSSSPFLQPPTSTSLPPGNSRGRSAERRSPAGRSPLFEVIGTHSSSSSPAVARKSFPVSVMAEAAAAAGVHLLPSADTAAKEQRSSSCPPGARHAADPNWFLQT